MITLRFYYYKAVSVHQRIRCSNDLSVSSVLSHTHITVVFGGYAIHWVLIESCMVCVFDHRMCCVHFEVLWGEGTISHKTFNEHNYKYEYYVDGKQLDTYAIT